MHSCSTVYSFTKWCQRLLSFGTCISVFKGLTLKHICMWGNLHAQSLTNWSYTGGSSATVAFSKSFEQRLLDDLRDNTLWKCTIMQHPCPLSMKLTKSPSWVLAVECQTYSNKEGLVSNLREKNEQKCLQIPVNVQKNVWEFSTFTDVLMDFRLDGICLIQNQQH